MHTIETMNDSEHNLNPFAIFAALIDQFGLGYHHIDTQTSYYS